MRGIDPLFVHCPNVLHLSFDSITLNTETLGILANHCQQLTSLSVHDCCCLYTVEELAQLFRYCPNLQTYCTNDLLADGTIAAITPHMKNIQTLKLECCHEINDNTLLMIAEHCVSLKDFVVDGTSANFTLSGLKSFLTKRVNTLKYLQVPTKLCVNGEQKSNTAQFNFTDLRQAFPTVTINGEQHQAHEQEVEIISKNIARITARKKQVCSIH